LNANYILCLSLSLCICGVASAQTPASTNQPESRLLTIEGSVQLLTVGTTNWSGGKTNQPLHFGDRLRTGARSRATVRLSDLTVLRVNELTTLQIREPRQAGKLSELDVNSGSTYFFSRSRPAEQEFRTPLTSGAIRGTEFNLAVAADGRTVVTLLDGQVTLTNSFGQVDMESGEQGVVEAGKAPVKTAVIEAINIIQWCLYYPGVLNIEELELIADEKRALADSLAAYASGDLLQAVALYPADRAPDSDSDRVYRAAMLLSAGQVEQAEALLTKLQTNNAGTGRAGKLAAALREVVATVKNQPVTRPVNPALATEWLAESYYLQSQAKLAEALSAARNAVAVSPNFSFGWARVAEMELSFGRGALAFEALERSLQLAPRNAQSLAVKGFLLLARNNVTEAERAFDQAIAIDGALGNAWLGRGLSEIRRGHAAAGRQDFQVAAVLEPHRAVLRSYLGKAFSNAGDNTRARKELDLARRLDANDPTAWLYSALVEQEENEINSAVHDLEKSEALNDNRRIFRSRLLLDEDQAVRSANLANIYQDAGMFDWSVREASRAVNLDYANYSAHQFLASSYDALRDPRQINLRYETPWFNELLLANLLSPVGAGNLSEFISQQEYSRLFEQNHFGGSSSTEYLSHGDWLERASQFGTWNDVSYAIDTEYRSERGWRTNNDLQQLTTTVKAKTQITPQDSLLVEGTYYDSTFGDTAQYYNQHGTIGGAPAPSSTFRGSEREQPLIFIGYNHEWAPGVHTLFLGGRLDDTLRYSDPRAIIPFTIFQGGQFTSVQGDQFALNYDREFTAYTAELQQIWQTPRQTLVVGGRYQVGWNDTTNLVNNPNSFPSLIAAQNFQTEIQRYSIYGYETVQLFDQLQITGGVTYDRLRYPRDIDTSPITGAEAVTEQFSPKAGIVWSPTEHTHLRGAYTRSLGGVFFDSSVRLEPTQVAGFNQAFRSIIPESVVGLVPGTRFTTYGVGLDQSFKTQTYLSIDGEILTSDAQRTIGVVTNSFFLPIPNSPGNTRQSLAFKEETLAVTLNQLVGLEWSLGARYQISHAHLTSTFVDLPAAAAGGVNQDQKALLQQLSLYINYNHPCGFFSQAQALWTRQDNMGYAPNIPGDDFWQFNVFAGYRFFHRAAEIKLGVLNLTDRDYLLNPLNLYYELPRGRTFMTSFKFYF
jgi:Tfp pilus assembly protein PilF